MFIKLMCSKCLTWFGIQISVMVPPATVKVGDPKKPAKKRHINNVSMFFDAAVPAWKAQKASQAGV